MKQNYLLKIVFCFLLISYDSYGQLVTTIDFENELDGYTPSTTSGSSNSYRIIFNRANYNLPNVTNQDGYYWAAEDIPSSAPNPYLNLNQIDVSGATSFIFSIDMTTRHFNDWDDTDELLITYSIDGGTYQNLMWIQNTEDGDAYNTPAALDIDFDGEGDCSTENTLPALITGSSSSGCNVSSSNFKTFTTNSISLTSNSTLDIKLQFNGLTSQAEGIYLDNIMITQSVPSVITWTGSSNSDWATSENWDSGVPSSSDNVTIPDVTNAPIIDGSTNVSVNDLTITEPDGLTINSDGSLIVSGISSGNVTYKRNLASTNWYLVSSPVSGETYDDAYVTANSIASSTENTNSRGIAPYVTSDDSWDYMQSGETATFTPGNGYSVKRSATGDVSFTGTLNVADAGVDVALSNAGNRFNLLGNPYTSHIASETFLNNEAAVSETQTLWIWNQATGTSGAYEVKTVEDAMVIAPSQGFFVKANVAGGTFNFTESNQASSGGTFQRTENRPEIYLTISNQTDAREAKIYYIENMTTGFDVGYEGELFNGVSNPLAIYTHLVADSEGQNYQVQSLPTNNYENMIVPLGVNAASGSAITIDASTNNFPEGVNIYLEDKQDNSFTLLNADANFSTTLDNSLSGIGRFYLHTSSGVLSADDFGAINNISIYKSSNQNLRIVGVQNGKATVQIYNILGKEVLKTSFEGNGVNDIKLNNLHLGLYILKLATEKDTINKKIIIQ
jgi:hypothetical protein